MRAKEETSSKRANVKHELEKFGNPWQEAGSRGLARAREEERDFWWIEDCIEWLEGKEARADYYTRLEELASLRG